MVESNIQGKKIPAMHVRHICRNIYCMKDAHRDRKNSYKLRDTYMFNLPFLHPPSIHNFTFFYFIFFCRRRL